MYDSRLERTVVAASFTSLLAKVPSETVSTSGCLKRLQLFQTGAQNMWANDTWFGDVSDVCFPLRLHLWTLISASHRWLKGLGNTLLSFLYFCRDPFVMHTMGGNYYSNANCSVAHSNLATLLDSNCADDGKSRELKRFVATYGCRTSKEHTTAPVIFTRAVKSCRAAPHKADLQWLRSVSVPNDGPCPSHSFNQRWEESRVDGWLWASVDAIKSHNSFPTNENCNDQLKLYVVTNAC